jgi:hypothetical protein
MKRESHPQKNTLLKNAASHPRSHFFKRVFFFPTQEEFFPSLFFLSYFPPPHGLPANPTSCASNVNFFGQSVCNLDTTPLRTDRRASGNSTYKKLAVQCSADSLVVNQTLVLRINICGENRHLRQARNRSNNYPFPPSTPFPWPREG